MNSKESPKDKPEDIAFRNNVINRLSNLESTYNTQREERVKAAKASNILKKNLGKAAREIAGLQSLGGFNSGLGNPTKIIK